MSAMNSKTRRRMLGVIGLGIAAATALSGCGASGDGGGDGDDGPVTIEMTWWGNAVREENTVAMAEAFMKENPDIIVKVSNAEFAGYWDKLSTRTAAGDSPDVIQMDDKFVREWAGRDALLDLDGTEIDVSQFVEGAADPGKTPEGFVAVSAGIIAPALIANPACFAAAGVDMPDDSTWTWDDYTDLAAELTAKSPEGTYGSELPFENELSVAVWFRQHGQDAFSEDGPGFDAEDLASWFQWNLDLQAAGGAPDADRVAEDVGKPIEQSAFVAGQNCMAFIWSNMINANDTAMGSNNVLLQYPTLAGDSAEGQLWYKASMLWSISSKSEHPEEAARLINFLVNSTEAGGIQKTERGIPANAEVRASIQDSLTDSDKNHIAYLEKIEPQLGGPLILPPVGGGNFYTLLERYGEDVLFERSTPEEAAEAMLAELQANIDAAK